MKYYYQNIELNKLENQIPDSLKSKNENFKDRKKEKFNGELIHLNNKKNIADGYYISKNYKNAILEYNEIIKQFEKEENIILMNDHDKTVYLNCLNNLLQCYLNLKNYNKAIDVGVKAISIDNKNHKLFYRLGKAYL